MLTLFDHLSLLGGFFALGFVLGLFMTFTIISAGKKRL